MEGNGGRKTVANSGQFAPGHAKKGGRRKGSRNKVGGDVRELAQTHTPAAIKTLVDVMRDDEAPPAARVMAANALLDRGHGKAPQAITGPEGGPLVEVNIDLMRDMLGAKLNRIAAAGEAARSGRLIEANGKANADKPRP
jgi:hypothetical protein